jgi:hypothetical protein
VVRGADFALDHLGADTAVEEIRTPRLLLEHGPIRLTKLVLFPVRFLFTAMTGRVGANETAVNHHLAGSRPVSGELARAAMAWRTALPDGSVALPPLAREMTPLYLLYSWEADRFGVRSSIQGDEPSAATIRPTLSSIVSSTRSWIGSIWSRQIAS